MFRKIRDKIMLGKRTIKVMPDFVLWVIESLVILHAFIAKLPNNIPEVEPQTERNLLW